MTAKDLEDLYDYGYWADDILVYFAVKGAAPVN